VFQGFNNRKKYAPYFENWMKGNSNWMKYYFVRIPDLSVHT
jgi:hypothetical protein